MLDLRGRSLLAPIIDPVAAGLSKARLTPTMVTLAGLAVTVVGAVFIGNDMYVTGALIAGFGSLLDALDGALARHQGVVSTKGAFIDTMSDRFGEIAIWTGLTFTVRDDGTLLMLCLFGLAFSLLTPYVRSKAESWGAEGRGGWMGRAERLILLLAGIGVAGLWERDLVLLVMLWVFVVLTGLTVAQRVFRTWQQLEA